MTTHVFVDEHKERGYLLVAAAIPSAALATSRGVMRAEVLPRQRRTHFKKERDARRNVLLDTMLRLDVEATIYDASAHPNPIAARAACIRHLVEDVVVMGAERLVFELDDAALHADRQVLYDGVRKLGATDTPTYTHLRAREECLLAVPEAIAWCWGKGGRWRQKVQAMVTTVRRV